MPWGLILFVAAWVGYSTLHVLPLWAALVLSIPLAITLAVLVFAGVIGLAALVLGR